MSDRREETKQIKRIVDDETVEQLVEGRTPRRTTTTGVKRRKKKKNRFALKSLITILAFVLVFVISFLISYTYFSAPSNAPEENNIPAIGTPVKDNDSTDPDEKAADDYYATDDMKPQSADDIPLEDEKDEEPVDEKPAVTPQQKPSATQQQKPASTPEQKPASKPQNSGTSNNNTSSGVVDNKENSEGLDFGL